jgi:predicted DNA-binding transcriptional regulator YafY
VRTRLPNLELNDDGRWHVPREALKRKDRTIMRAQVLAMDLGARLSTFLWSPRRIADIESRIDKLRAELLTHEHQRMLDWKRRVAVVAPGQKRYDENPEVSARIALLLDAMIECRPTSLRYTSPTHMNADGPGRALVVHPLGVVFYRDGLYFIVDVSAASPELAGERRLLAVDRMHDVTLHDAGGFKVPRDFDARSFFGDALGIYPEGEARDVVVEVDASHAPWVLERTLHTSQQLEQRTDGSVLVRLHVASATEVIDWVLSFGAHAELVEPADLRARMCATLAAAHARYSSGGDIS